MKKITPFFVALFLTGFTQENKAQTVPLVLENMLNTTLDSMQLFINNKSLSASIQLSNTAVWEKASGISSVVPYANATSSDAYEIGSVTKTLTAACVLQLVDQGILSLDDSIHEWLDTISFVNPNITIRQLLRHQSGLYEVLNNPACQPAMLADQDSVWEAEPFINTYIQSAPAAPGGTWSYCNTGYFLLGMIIEQATGNPFYSEIRSRFLSPSGLNTFAIPSFEPYTNPVAHAWMDITGDGITEDAHSFYYNWMSLKSAVAAAGGYYATATDVTKWMRSYMRGDLHTSSIMTEAQTTITAPGISGTYGLGLMKKSFIGFTGYGHGGDLVYSASSWYFPAKDISITVLNNDAEIISWDLVPVVIALLKTYNQWEAATSVSEFNSEAMNFFAYPNPFVNDFSIRMNLKEPVSSLQLVMTNALGSKFRLLKRII